jgi:uncharacterized protein (DUF1501 family)
MTMRQERNARREFLKSFSATLAGGTALSLFPQLKLIESALAAPNAGAYRALVCVYLGGGNDAFNLLIPSDATRHATYLTSRGGVYAGTLGPLGIAQSALLPVNLTGLPAGHTYGLHPACADWQSLDKNGVQSTMPGLQTLTNQGKVAWLPNIGTLVTPLTKTTYALPSVPKPPQLFSHSDQTNVWFQGRSTANFTRGWGGQIADLLFSQNGTIGTSGVSMPMGVSIAGANRFLVGNQTVPYQVSACGNPLGGTLVAGTGVGVNFLNCSGSSSLSNFRACSTTGLNPSESALCQLLNAPNADLFQAEQATIMKRSMELAAQLNVQVAGTTSATASLLSTPFRAVADEQPVVGYNVASDGGNSLAEQLAMVARMIKVSTALGQNRNVFFVSLGGFDTHATQMADNTQPRLLRRVSRALGSFYKALEEMSLQNNVTAFTVSDFGRTLNSNGDGTDHGWGSISFVMGGSVIGGKLYGTFPDQTLNGPDSFSRGQMIPTTSADQLAATLGGWMGVSAGNLQTIFPHLQANFSAVPTAFNMGFMNPAPV